MFIKKEPILCTAALLAAASVFLTPPDAAYGGYIHWATLSTLFCLMAVIAGLRGAGLFDALAQKLTAVSQNGRAIGFALTGVCFFLSALLTNDVTLLTFVPFTLRLYAGDRRLVPLLVLETAAANLGSLLTPVGNPQNLFLFAYYGLTPGDFFSVTLPLGGACLVLTALTSVLLLRDKSPMRICPSAPKKLPLLPIMRCGVLFILCLLSVLRAIDWRVSLAATVLCLLIFDRKLFKQVDYSLLLSFVFFFILVGNLARVEAVSRFMRAALSGRELWVSALTSQVISNVPAAAMLAPFTENWRDLLAGVNIGGLGTLIASMASLITYRLYAVSENAKKGRYFALFSLVNFAMLAVLLLLYTL